jgi:hypothetical protein
MSNPTFTTIDAARVHAEDFMEELMEKSKSRVAGRLHTIFAFPSPANVVSERELQNIVTEEIRKEIYGA